MSQMTHPLSFFSKSLRTKDTPKNLPNISPFQTPLDKEVLISQVLRTFYVSTRTLFHTF